MTKKERRKKKKAKMEHNKMIKCLRRNKVTFERTAKWMNEHKVNIFNEFCYGSLKE